MGAYGIEASNTSKDECAHEGYCIWSLIVEIASDLTCSIKIRNDASLPKNARFHISRNAAKSVDNGRG